MPTYEYRCEACSHQFDEFQSITAKPLRKCPQCGQSKLRRLIGIGAGVIFKGSGFYETDYRSAGYKKAAKAESDSGKPAAGSDSAPSSASTSSTGSSTSSTAKTPIAAKPAKGAASSN